MIVFTYLAPAAFWLLILLWLFILVFYLRRLRVAWRQGAFLATLLLILSIDAFRNLFESVYFGAWYTSVAGLLPQGLRDFLVQPVNIFVPKFLSLIVTALIIAILLNRWIPEEEAERRRVQDYTRELERLSFMDSLTGLYNRRALLLLGEKQFQIARRSGQRFSLLYVDINDFKWINDNLGHAAGDEALKTVAGCLRQTFRESDVLARLGGDEFVVLLAGTPKAASSVYMARLEQCLVDYNAQPGRAFRLSLSSGLVCYDAERDPSIDELLKEADELMYEDKRRKSGAPPLEGRKT